MHAQTDMPKSLWIPFMDSFAARLDETERSVAIMSRIAKPVILDPVVKPIEPGVRQSIQLPDPSVDLEAGQGVEGQSVEGQNSKVGG